MVLKTGQIFVGKLKGYGTEWPVLDDVMYVQRVVYKDNPSPQDTLVRRTHEWHSPDRMILNSTQILFVEPVSQNSAIMRTIEGIHEKNKR